MIDPGSLAGLQTSLALDNAGRPHVGYVVGGSVPELRHMWFDGTFWQTATIATGDYSYPSLALDSSGQPRVAYISGWPSYVAHASFDGTAWHTETITPQGAYPSLALDSANRPHIAYLILQTPYAGVGYAWNDGTGWQTETVDIGGIPSLVLDGAGRPHIAYGSSATSGLTYAWHDGSGWNYLSPYVDSAQVGKVSLPGHYPKI